MAKRDPIDRLRRLREKTGGPPSGGWRGKQAALGWEVLGLAEALRHEVRCGRLPCPFTEHPDSVETLRALERRLDELGVE